MDADRDKLGWKEIETWLNQIDAATGLDQEVCRPGVARLLPEQDRIEYVLGLDVPAESKRCSGAS
jgi:hypothetical protein